MIPKPDESRAEPPRTLVLDTNVCLDLFVFRDPRWHALLSALRQSQVRAYTRADCRMEWMLVLAYTKLGLDADQQAAALAEFDQLIALLPGDAAHDNSGSSSGSSAHGDGCSDACSHAGSHKQASLPLCRDPDDQKFIELAAQCGAGALVTKDKLVLKLARKMKKLALFRILSPEQWTAEWLASPAAATTPNSSALVQGGVTGDAPTLQ